MTNLNETKLIGRLTRDSEFKKTENGLSVLKFSIAVNRDIKTSTGIEHKVDFFDTAIFDTYAENLKDYMKQGTLILVYAHLGHNIWESDGKKHSEVKIICDKVELLSSPKDKTEIQENSIPAQQTLVDTNYDIF